jgi:hypothetical protein
MGLAQTNKKIREELEQLNKEAMALSAIWQILINHLSVDQRNQIKSEVKALIRTQFSQETMSDYYQRHAGLVGRMALEHEALEVSKPQEKKL